MTCQNCDGKVGSAVDSSCCGMCGRWYGASLAPKPLKKALPTPETDLVKLFVARIPFVIPQARAWRRQIVDDISMRGHRILAGVEGQADVYVYCRGGRVIEVEAKMAKGRMRDAQIAWAAFCKAWSIPHLVVRAIAGEEATATVERWTEELRRVIG